MNEDSSGLNQNTTEKRVHFSTLFRRFVLYLVILAAGLSLDLGTKSWIFGQLGRPGESETWWMIDGVFGCQTSLNQGALFGIGQGNVHIFALFSFAAIAGILVWLLFFRGLCNLFFTIVLGMISAGILGNLYDRLGLHRLKWNYADELHQVGDPVYAVRDWILVMIGNWPWPNFNIADSLLVCGAILLMVFITFFVKDDAS